MDRDTDDPISRWLDQTSSDPAGGLLAMRVTRLQAAAVLVTEARMRSVTVTIIDASGDPTLPTVNGLAYTRGTEIIFLSDYPGYQLRPVTIETDDGDDVLVVETWDSTHFTATPPPTPHDPSLLLEDGFVLLLESGDRLLLE